MKAILTLLCLLLTLEKGLAQSKFVKSVYSLPLTLDPIKMNDTSSLLISNLIYDGLLKFSPNLEIKSALAKSWITSSDGRTLTFHLKENQKFHDGSPILASDVVFSLKRNISRDSLVRSYYDCIEGFEGRGDESELANLGIVEKDSLTVQIKLKFPFPAFLNVLAGATAKILPEKHLKNENFFKKPIGSGPFKILQVKKNEIIFKRNSTSPSRAQDLFIIRESSEKVAIEQAQRGEIHDLTNWPLTSNNKIFRIGKKFSSPVAATWIIGLNTLKSPFQKSEIRRKFKADFDNEKFRKTFYPDAYPAQSYIPPGLPGHQKIGKMFILTEKVNPSKDIVKIAIPKELERHQEMGNLIKSEMEAKGWTVQPIYLEWQKLMEGYKNKTLQAFLVSMNMDYPDPEFLLRNFESKNSDNFSGINSSQIDHLLEVARKENDRLKRTKIHQEIVELVESSAVTVNLFHPRANLWLADCVKDFKGNILSDVYIDYSEINIENCK